MPSKRCWAAALTPGELLGLARLWAITEANLDEAVVALRLRSLTESLGVDPLTWALHAAAAQAGADAAVQAGDEAAPPQPAPEEIAAPATEGAPLWTGESLSWRCAHRDLRIDFAQPDLQPWLAPLLAEMLDDVPLAPAPAAPPEEPAADNEAWMLILEFGHSRSEYFEFALRQAQRQPGFSALVDDQRHVIYRVRFAKSEMRRFWQLWEYAMNWAETHVYLNGKKLEKWKVYPYSQYLT